LVKNVTQKHSLKKIIYIYIFPFSKPLSRFKASFRKELSNCHIHPDQKIIFFELHLNMQHISSFLTLNLFLYFYLQHIKQFKLRIFLVFNWLIYRYCLTYCLKLIALRSLSVKFTKRVTHQTRQTSASRINRNYLSVLIQQIGVLLISSQSKISRRYLVYIILMFIIF
jgi:hypothetical protein